MLSDSRRESGLCEVLQRELSTGMVTDPSTGVRCNRVLGSCHRIPVGNSPSYRRGGKRMIKLPTA